MIDDPAESYDELLAAALQKNEERERRLQECAFCEHGYEDHDLQMVERKVTRGSKTYVQSVLSDAPKACTKCDCNHYAGLRRVHRYGRVKSSEIKAQSERFGVGAN